MRSESRSRSRSNSSSGSVTELELPALDPASTMTMGSMGDRMGDASADVTGEAALELDCSELVKSLSSSDVDERGASGSTIIIIEEGDDDAAASLPFARR